MMAELKRKACSFHSVMGGNKPQTATVRLSLAIPSEKEEIYQQAMKQTIAALRQDKEVDLLGIRRGKTEKTTNWSFTVAKSKENLLKAVLWGYLLAKSMTNDGNTEQRQVWSDIMLQSKNALRRTESSLSTTLLKKNGGRG